MSQAHRGVGVRRVLLITLLANVIVAATKLVNGVETHTLSLKADGFHSAVDAINNLVGLVGVWWSLRPPDAGHPYGHQKVEVLAAGGVGISLVLMAYSLVCGAVGRFEGAGVAPQPTVATLWLLAGTLIVNWCVAVYEARAAKRLKSTFLESDASHTRSDILVTLGVFVTVLAIRSGYPWLDIGFTSFIAMVILLTGVRLVLRNFNYLMDSAQVEVAEVETIACQVPGVAGANKIRTRGSPAAIVMDLHVQVARHLNVSQAHKVTNLVVRAILEQVEGVQDVMVHTEPAAAEANYPALPSSVVAES